MDRVGGAFVFDSSNRSLIVLFLQLFNPLPFISLWLTRQSYPTPAKAPFTPPIVGHSVIISQSQLSILELSFGQIKLIGVVKEEVNPLITTSIETDSCFQLARDLLPKKIAQAAVHQLTFSRVSLLIAGLSPKNQSVECVWSWTIVDVECWRGRAPKLSLSQRTILLSVLKALSRHKKGWYWGEAIKLEIYVILVGGSKGRSAQQRHIIVVGSQLSPRRRRADQGWPDQRMGQIRNCCCWSNKGGVQRP